MKLGKNETTKEKRTADPQAKNDPTFFFQKNKQKSELDKTFHETKNIKLHQNTRLNKKKDKVHVKLSHRNSRALTHRNPQKYALHFK